jgi:hypothetical protein
MYELEQTSGRIQRKWELTKVGGEWKVIEVNKTLNAESGIAKPVAYDEAKGGGVERYPDEAGPSGNRSGAAATASGEVEGTGFVNGRPVINRLFIERLFASDSEDSDDDWWTPDEGFHEGNNLEI